MGLATSQAPLAAAPDPADPADHPADSGRIRRCFFALCARREG